MDMVLIDGLEKPVSLLSASLFTEDEESEQTLLNCLKGSRYARIDGFRGGVKEAIQKFSKEDSPSLLVIDISMSEMPLSDLQALANVCAPDIRVIAIGRTDSVALYRNLISCGVSDYFVKPLPQDLLYQSIHGEAKNQEDGGTRTGKIVSLCGVSGGVGVSALVCSLGQMLSAEASRRTMIVDLDFELGDCGHHFGMGGRGRALSLWENPERLDALLIERAAQTIEERLDILFAEHLDAGPTAQKIEVFHKLKDHLKKRYHFILLDIVAENFAQKIAFLEHSETAILIFEPGMLSLRKVKLILDTVPDQGISVRYILVLSQTRPVQRYGCSLAQIEEFLGRKVDIILPYEGKFAEKAVLDAVPLSSRSLKYKNAVLKLLGILTGSERSSSRRVFTPFPFLARR
ncbi:MAG: hypothetical protein MI743_22465 [Sneathiellales bacterium]|nr:hypothetical protein [Sneathiellales bacterium]